MCLYGESTDSTAECAFLRVKVVLRRTSSDRFDAALGVGACFQTDSVTFLEAAYLIDLVTGPRRCRGGGNRVSTR